MKKNKPFSVREEKEGLDYSSLEEKAITKSRHYHAYYEGYAERRVWNDAKKKACIERVYVEDFYVRRIMSKSSLLWKLLYFAVFASGMAAYIWGSVQRIPVSRYVYLPGFALIVTAVFLMSTLISMAAIPKKMTVWEYRSGSRRLIKLSFAAALFAFLQSAAVGVYLLAVKEAFSRESVVGIVGNLLSSLLFDVLFFTEKRTVYFREANENENIRNDESAVIIQE